MRASAFVFLTLMATCLANNDVEKPCSIVTLFSGATGKADPTTPVNPPDCKSIKSTCCVAQDFTVIKNNYNGPLEGSSEKELSTLVNSRIGYLDTILTSFLSSSNAIRKRAVDVGQGKNLEQPCKLSSANLATWTVPTDLVANTKAAVSKCWTYYNLYNQGAICGMCNNDFGTAYSL